MNSPVQRARAKTAALLALIDEALALKPPTTSAYLRTEIRDLQTRLARETT